MMMMMETMGVRLFSWLAGHSRKRRVRHVCTLLLLVVLVLVVVMVVMEVTDEEGARLRKFKEDSYLAMSWQGFPAQERGVYNFTVVTAMLDIGRGQWSSSPHGGRAQTRSYNTYLLYLLRVLRLDVNLVLFVDAQALPFVHWVRRGRQNRTHVVLTSLPALPYFRHRRRVQDIMDSERYRRDNELVRRGLCESWVPEYDILQWSKLHFVNETIAANPFGTDLFLWLDGGYGHGDDIHPADGVWRPKDLFQHVDRVTFIERESVERYRAQADRLHKMSVNAMAGLFFAGGRAALQRLYRLQQELIADWLKRGIVDDDQTTYMQIYFKHPELFRLVPGDWDDVFKLFHASQ